jgi:hypothetical protein
LVGARAGFISYEEVDVGGVGVQQSPQGEKETPRKTRPEELSQTTPKWKREMGLGRANEAMGGGDERGKELDDHEVGVLGHAFDF